MPDPGLRHIPNIPSLPGCPQTPLHFFPIVKEALVEHADLLDSSTAHQDSAPGDPIYLMGLNELLPVNLILCDMARLPVVVQLAARRLDHLRLVMVVDHRTDN